MKPTQGDTPTRRLALGEASPAARLDKGMTREESADACRVDRPKLLLFR
jgi:hypothetical protein